MLTPKAPETYHLKLHAVGLHPTANYSMLPGRRFRSNHGDQAPYCRL